ncbi:MAG: nitroreductase family protein [Bacteroidales bacterium]|nr:nitroreductase family protein [Bacteroidales bacterium]
MNDTIKTINNHRSIRHYSDKPIADAVLQEILTSATRGSTTGNMQLYSIIVTRDKQMKQQIAPLHFNQPAVAEAPVILTFCADFNRFIRWCDQRNARHGFNNIQCLMWAIADALIAAQNAAIAAEAHNLGICYMGTVTYNIKPLSKIYNLPKYVVPVACITLGYPAEQGTLSDRLPLEAVVHQETYHNYSAEDIDRLYAEKEALPLTKQLLEENQMENLAKIFAERRYTKQDNEHFAKELLEFLQEQDFLPANLGM